ncbi:alpha/beta hydrolase [Neobacillus muris]|uniref:alpha/beta hydrolase n=1 Tax=Neobacillus muris TaxID=2941334 RepID=UPI00203D44E1|nr:alpha/beta hydrolase [Neobacillus muris]
MKYILSAIAAIFLLSSFSWENAYANGSQTDIKTIRLQKSRANNIELLPNIVYTKIDGIALKLHLLVPKHSDKQLPLIIYIKGGGWGKNHPQKSFSFIPSLVQFAKRGYVVASVEHRTSHAAKFPAQLHDIKAAVRYLKANAGKYHINPDKVGVWGSSSGGHLAALLGTSGGIKQLEGNSYNQSTESRVQAVVDWYGPTDFSQMSKFPSEVDFDAADSPESILIGGPVQEHPDQVKLANPITYITPDDPPFLIMHGDKDKRVPYNQSVLLYQALKKANVEVTMYRIKGAGHGGFSEPAILNIVQEYFDLHLKKR